MRQPRVHLEKGPRLIVIRVTHRHAPAIDTYIGTLSTFPLPLLLLPPGFCATRLPGLMPPTIKYSYSTHLSFPQHHCCVQLLKLHTNYYASPSVPEHQLYGTSLKLASCSVYPAIFSIQRFNLFVTNPTII